MAKGAYERSRSLFALRVAAPVALLPMVSFLLGTSARSASLLGAGLVVSIALVMWRGGPFAWGGFNGLKAGAIPLVLAHAAKLVGHVCTPAGCTTLCVPACATGGIAAGLLIEWFARQGPSPNVTRVLGVTVAVFTGGLGCACVGSSGLLAMVVGLGASLVGGRLVPARA
jgi:hypothetical protein